MYSGAVCMIKAGWGLSTPVKVERGVRQGCPLSGLLYSISTEPLLCLRRRRLGGLKARFRRVLMT